MKDISVSVALAAYNGEKYISEQAASILKQLSDTDELVISVDPSHDQTVAIISSFHDPRIKMIPGPGHGAIQNFENAIGHCQNDIIFLSDQDDIWLPGKVEKVMHAFDADTTLVMHDAKIVDSHLNTLYDSYFAYHKCQRGLMHNIVRNSYMGCCMAFRKELKPYILPFPEKIPMHDQWIGLVSEKVGKNVLCDESLILYRRHEDNVSSMHHASWKQMIQWRIHIVKAIRKIRK